MTGMGALAALALWVWIEIGLAEVLAGRALLVGVIATGVFFAALLAISPRMALPRALLFSAALAGVAAALMLLTSWRYDSIDGLAAAFFPSFAAFILCSLPLPFFIAQSQGNWRDYATLFEQSWDIVLRFAVAAVLIGTVWLLIFLSDLLLSLVGLSFISLLLELDPAGYLITGAAGGFGIAVAAESMTPKGANLAHMLLRPLLPLILAVVALFLIALPFRGLSSLFGTLSAGMTLMAICAVAATLVTAVVDARGEAASNSKILAASARVMGILMAVLGALAVIAVTQRTLQYGWTPARFYAALAAGVSLGYGVFYATAMPRSDWMERIRRANVAMALCMIAVAALVLTPALNAERISTNSQMARFADGRTPPNAVDVSALQNWGTAGQQAIAELTALSKTAGQEALALRLANPDESNAPDQPDLEKMRRELVLTLPLQPPNQTAAQNVLLQGMYDFALEEVQLACARNFEGLPQACVMIVADFLTDVRGDEGLIAILGEDGGMQFYGLTQDQSQSNWAQVDVTGASAYPAADEAIALLRAWQTTMPPLTPAPVNQIEIGTGGLLLLP